MAADSSDRYQSLAAAILPLVGGAPNVASAGHCMTRLRLTLADRSLVREPELRALPGVLGVVADDDTYQLVLGPGVVDRVTAAFGHLTAGPPQDAAGVPPGPGGTARGDTTETYGDGTGPHGGDAGRLAARGAAIRAARRRENATPAKVLLRRIAAVFVPLIPALIGCGVIAGLAGLLTNLGWLPGVTPALSVIAAGFMALIAVFVGVNTAAEFGGTPVLGGAVAAVVVFPGVTGITVLGHRLAPGQGGVLGALAAASLGVCVERWCRRHVPAALDVLLTPTLTVLVTGLVTLYGLMWAAGRAAQAVGTASGWLLEHTGVFAGLVLGGLFLPLVMLGLHQALIPIHTTLIEQQGYTVLLPILAMAGAGQVGAALAVYVRLRGNDSIRTTVRSALPAGFLGIGEPLIYGVSLPLGRPFVTACAGGAAGGAFVGFFSMLGDSVGSTAIGPSGWALFPLLDGTAGLGTEIAIYAGGLATGYAVGFGATYAFGFTRQMLADLGGAPAPAPTTELTERQASA